MHEATMRPKIVILGSRFPLPLIKGDRLRLYHHIRVLSGCADIHLICIEEDYPSDDDLEQLRPFCKSMNIHVLPVSKRNKNIARHMASSMPMQVRYFFDQSIRQQVQWQIKELHPNHVFVQLIRMAPYVEGLSDTLTGPLSDDGYRGRVSLSIDYMDSMVLNDLAGSYLDTGFKKLLQGRERRLVQAYERRVFDWFDHHYIISERDQVHLHEEHRERVNIMSNGVDTSYYTPLTQGKSTTYDVLFCGNMSYPPNVAAGLLIRDELCGLSAEYQFVIAGASNDQLSSKGMPKNCAILGYQEDMRDMYHAAQLMVVPIFSGSGQQNKVLEAMACGLPTIVTSFVNKAIGADAGVEVLIADDIVTFGKCIKSLLSQPELYRSVQKAGRSFVEQRFDWNVNSKALVEALQKI